MRGPWWTPRAITLHVALLIVVPGFLVLGRWQLHRALGGNTLSWAYTVLWPFFSFYAIYVWWKLVHEPSASASAHDASEPRSAASMTTPPGDELGAPNDDGDQEDAELAAYNAYLASLRRGDRRGA